MPSLGLGTKLKQLALMSGCSDSSRSELQHGKGLGRACFLVHAASKVESISLCLSIP